MKNINYLLPALALVLTGCSTQTENMNNATPTLKTVIYESFEQGGWNAENTTLSISTHQPGLNTALPKNFLFAQLQGPHSFSAEQSIVRYGDYSAKLHWKHANQTKYNGDPKVLDNTDRKAMFHGYKAQSNIATVWYGFSAYFPSEDTQLKEGQGALFFQIHGARDGNKEPNRIPPVSINLVKDGFTMGYSWDSKKLSTSTHGEGNKTFEIPAKLADYQDRWVDFVLKVKTNPFEKKGELNLWIDGKHVVNRTNVKVGYNDDMGVYPSFGWYLWGDYAKRDQDVIMYLDEVRQAQGDDINYQDVASKAN
ncbi:MULTISPECIES: heparin lyase I family protein [Pseudoalteromonas]|uniref:heparin lyase I family protein n=1 Tax=Pseudoalteromonas TaxID=53246 RepID=UPI00030865EF|nr:MULTISPECIES: heparin lyase I family protein [Pseudoalteromonas]